ncbi:hypothetical protein [uncultured Thiodictyon sp.]|uniref:3-hydroxyacyl-ACP dehydratase FabZ family protein n=1 Tax=uncultured Thiodictyon sp. TaxID=1846217 RepID=UPI0025D47AEA|nr:hypothetical protein [uncultured Thiodictyon sp.]
MMEVSLPLSVAADHPAYAGHFPGQPILPGVVLLDEALHALAVRQGLEGAVGQIKSAKFPSPVTPGEALRLRYVETTAGFFRFEVTAGERLAASGVFAFAATGSGTAAE